MSTSSTTTETAYALATAEEIQEVRRLLEAEGLVIESTRFAYLGLLDPQRHAPEATGQGPGAGGEPETERRFRAFLLDTGGAGPKDVTEIGRAHV